jgi:transcriptional regulator with XRE-family HTH domain
MAQQIPGINPQLLVWARKRAGQSIADVAAAMHKAPNVIESWESGAAAPTYVQLETLAYKVFKRPVALFFFPEPPDEVDPEHEFRTLPGAEIDDLHPDTRLKVREAQALQIQLAELTGGTNPAARHILRDIDVTVTSPVKSAVAVRDYLAVPLSTQTDVWRSVDDAPPPARSFAAHSSQRAAHPSRIRSPCSCASRRLLGTTSIRRRLLDASAAPRVAP